MAEDHLEDEPICRICHMEAITEKPFFYPCKCTGSMKYIHQHCMLEWLRISNRKTCEVCGYPIKLTPIYRENMPHEMSIYTTVWFSIKKILQFFKKFILLSLLLLLWSIISPYFTFRITKFLYFATIGNITEIGSPINVIFQFNVREAAYGIINAAFSLLLAYGFYFLANKLSQFHEPWWIRSSCPHMHSDHNLWRTHINIIPTFFKFLWDLVSSDPPFTDGHIPQQPVVSSDDGSSLPNEDVTSPEPSNVWRWIHVENYSQYFENFFYATAISLVMCISVSFCTYLFLGIPFLRYNFVAYYIAKSTIGVIFVNLLFFYYFVCFVLYAMHLLFKPCSIFFFGNFFIFMKIIVIIFIEYFIIPTIVGFLLIQSVEGIVYTNSWDSFFIFPIDNIKLAYSHVIGFVSIFWIMNSLLLIDKKLRTGVLWFIQDPAESSFNPIYDMVYDGIFVWNCRMLLSASFCMSYISITVLAPLYLINTFFHHISSYFTHLPIYKLNLDFYILVQFTPLLVSMIGFNEIFEFIACRWISLLSYLFGLESYLLGIVPLLDGTLVWNRNGSHIYSSDTVWPPVYTSRFKSYYRTDFFHLKVFTMFCLTVSTLISCISLIGFIFISLSFTLTSLLTGSRMESLSLNLFLGLNYFLITYLCTYYAIWGCIKLKQEFYRQLRKGIRGLILVVIFCFVIPLLTGRAIDCITLSLRYGYSQTRLINPLHDWYVGFMVMKIYASYVEFIPLNFINNRFDLIEIQTGFRLMSFDILFYKVAIPYIRNILLFLTIPYVIIFGILNHVGLSDEIIYLMYQYSYSVLFDTIFLYYSLNYVKSSISNLRNTVRDQMYLVGHVLENIDNSVPSNSHIIQSDHQHLD